MTEPGRVLRPLDEAESAIERLETYESPAVLQEALRATWAAVDRSLRLLLRSDAAAPDTIRMAALSETELPADAVLAELRRRDRVTLALAGSIHALWQAAHRPPGAEPHAADADAALDAVRELRRQVQVASRRVSGVRDVAESEAVARSIDSAESHAAPEPDDVAWSTRRGGRRGRLIGLALAVLVTLLMTTLLVLGRDSDLERGIAAFEQDRAGVAEQHFRAELERDERSITARLYLARILRAQGRAQEAAELLSAAARLAPADAAVRRELGYLFLQLGRAEPAAEQFRMAVELDPAEPLNWVGVVQALRRAGDASADEWLRRAPAEAQSLLRSRQP